MTQNYDALDMSEMLEEADRFATDEEAAGGNNQNFLEKFVIMPEKEGFVVVRLMPPAKGKKFYCATRTHRLIKNEQDRTKGGRNFHCPRELVTGKGGKKYWVDTDPKDPCPICMYTRGIWADLEAAEGGRVDTKNLKTMEGKRLHGEYSRIKAIERYYYNGTVRFFDKKGNLEKSEGPKILSIGKTLHERIVRAVVGDPKAGEKGLGDVSDLMNGRDFKIVKKFRPNSTFPYYDDSKFLDPSPLGDTEQVAIWLANLHDLAALRVVKATSDIDIALQKYTGALPDDDTNFDMSKYRKKADAGTLDEAVAAEKAKPTAKTTAKVVNATATEDGALAENKFLEGLDDELEKVGTVE